MSLRKFLAVVLTVLAVSAAATACHTIHGVGQDVSAGGQAIQRASSSN